MFARSVRWIALVLIIVGAIGLRARRWEIALLLAPVAISLCAGLAHLFPVHGRLQLWLFPPFAILASSGIGTLAQLITSRATRFRYAVIAAISAPLAFGVAQATVRSALKAPPWAFEEVEPNLRLLAHHRAQDDTTIVTLDAEKALLLYSDKAGLRGLRYRRLAGRRDQPWCALRNLRNLPAHGRLWLLTYHDVPVNEPGEKVLLAGLARRGRIQIIGSEPGSRLYRVDLARKVADAPIPPECFRPADFIGFRGLLAARHELVPMDPEGKGPA